MRAHIKNEERDVPLLKPIFLQVYSIKQVYMKMIVVRSFWVDVDERRKEEYSSFAVDSEKKNSQEKRRDEMSE